ncbi:MULTISPECIES: type II toxin-antitoxin system RelE family toxin [Nosocomiicoccus]|uniref:Type II toxin-antitoxin system RelE/ParE family toxin n=1 Tax=Nosocomiicoccus massiliensis TaxID=1232430 RepID=A0AAF1BQY1_9STAP|nr:MULTISPECIES: type II toxin-antitoxin system RelE/ParE family toxin [Nosocomiicoccus]MDK6863461.1 type II toxin-antitoxin system RelE/ParE family toxin [Nosocomiicoccus ampullae]OFL49099.1 addiction module toxin RelE [Nosocomiicoccus sp. HMSC067E10]OFO53416.1 addiction module toxin RelE [Nosocomiicoccus sp. HMSC059G07]OFS62163.1 addiction module toxin RelE [Nosocomiicoccus sp. HMSC09A07]WOS95498.1 type II toxin-antitoxin system RelE/ParE family toxin [Nosocomiicoccus massiliensis]
MKYQVIYSKRAVKELKKLDKSQSKLLISWIEKNLKNTENPRKHGKNLKGVLNEYWRYRVGKYRIISIIDDNKIIINIISVGHRSNIYK